MGRIKWKRIVILAVCIGVSLIWAASIRVRKQGIMKAIDFGRLYYGTRCAIQHKDPYDGWADLHEFEAEGGKVPDEFQGEKRLRSFLVDIYPPTAFFILVPFAMAPLPVSAGIWLCLITVSMILAAYLAWDLASDAPIMGGFIAGFVLLNCVVLLVTSNVAGIVAPFCVIGAWCFLKERFALSGVALLGICLVMKPHDAGFVWLFFLLVGGIMRKRALQTLAVVVVLSVCAAIWIAPRSPHWFGEIQRNVTLLSSRGNLADPGISGEPNRSLSPIICLQNAVSVFRDDPHFYNPLVYLIVGSLILIWVVAALRKRATQEGALLALAAISALTMLPVYQRAEDAKLLLLLIPACAMLWARGGRRRWVALALTSAAILVTSDIPIVLVVSATHRLAVSTSTFRGKLTLLALQPAPLVLLATACFYLWLYVRWPLFDGALTEAAADVETKGKALRAAHG